PFIRRCLDYIIVFPISAIRIKRKLPQPVREEAPHERTAEPEDGQEDGAEEAHAGKASVNNL
ncbi:MAG: hypothetical protein GX215_07750, partial [Clostridiales Family XIII bacterium]|nr:hypothetical protein [Clostridiales Family XIII bacterium]